MISVIIPVYNGEKYIKECIESILNQTYNDIEIIIVNDGSTDNTIKILNSFSDKRITIINQENQGVSTARNKGLEIAKGKYILFFDADDFMKKNMIEVMYNDIIKNNVQAVKSNLYLYYKDKDKEKEILYSEKIFDGKNKIIDSSSMLDMVISGEVMAFSPNIMFEKPEKPVKYNEKIFYMEDVIFYISILENIKKIYIENKPLFSYRQNEDSATRDQNKILKNIYSLKNYNREAKKELKKVNLYTEERAKMINTRNTILISDLLSQINYNNVERKEAIKIFKTIFENEGNIVFLQNFSEDKLLLYKLMIIKLGIKKRYNLLYYYIKFRKICAKIRNIVKK